MDGVDGDAGGGGSDLLPAGGGDLQGLGAHVALLVPDFGDHVGGVLADGWSEVDVDADVVVGADDPDDDVVDVWEGETPFEVGSVAVIRVSVAL